MKELRVEKKWLQKIALEKWLHERAAGEKKIQKDCFGEMAS